MKVDFKRLTWENYPSTETPINADNLNRLEEGVAGLYSDLRDIEQELDGGVGEYVTDWLNEHVDPVGSAVVVDNTLSIEGAAADAKKVGDEILGSKVVVDDTLSIEGAAADAKKTGDELTSLKEDYSDILNSAYVTDTASGSIASFPDGADNVPVKSLKVNIEPVQDLHGYDHPWPGGGNVNKLPPAASFETITSGNSKITPYPDGHYHLSKTAGSNSDMLTINLASPVAVSTNQYIYYISNASSGNMIANLLGDNGTIDGGYWGKPSANIASEGIATRWQFYFTAGIAGEFDLWPIISDAPVTEFSPYSNICPISGHSTAVVTRTGFNQWDEQWERATIDWNTYKFTPDESGGRIAPKNFIPVLSGKTYYITRYVNNVLIGYADKNSNGISISNNRGVFTVPDGIHFIKFGIEVSGYGTTYNHDISINYPSTDHDYHEGHVQTVTIDLDGTIYGGTLDVLTGVLTVDRQMVDLGTLNWRRDTTTRPVDGATIHAFYAELYTAKRIGNNVIPNMYSSQFIADTINNVDYGGQDTIKDNICSGADQNARIWVYGSTYNSMTTDEFKTAMNGVQLCYELAEFQTIQLTAQEVRTLLGQNNVFADCGDVSVEYRADTKLYIEKLTAPTEDDMVADHAISANSFFMVGNNLYRATTAIASGATITVGTNATKLSLSDALNALA